MDRHRGVDGPVVGSVPQIVDRDPHAMIGRGGFSAPIVIVVRLTPLGNKGVLAEYGEPSRMVVARVGSRDRAVTRVLIASVTVGKAAESISVAGLVGANPHNGDGPLLIRLPESGAVGEHHVLVVAGPCETIDALNMFVGIGVDPVEEKVQGCSENSS